MPAPRVFTSSKYHAALIVTVLGAVPVLYQLHDPSIARADKTELLKTFIAGATVAWTTAVAAEGAVDYAKNRDAPSGNGAAVPSVMVNTGSDAANTQTTVAPPPASDPPVPTMSPDLLAFLVQQKAAYDQRTPALAAPARAPVIAPVRPVPYRPPVPQQGKP